MIIGNSITAPAISVGLHPIIRATALPGSLLTCGSQTYQLSALETTHDFVVTISSTAYIVTATLGTQTGSSTVLVDSVALYPINILMRLYLYKEGDECSLITGGWTTPTMYSGSTTSPVFDTRPSSSSSSTVQQIKNTDNLQLYLNTLVTSAYRFQVSFYTVNAIDFTNYNSLYFDVEFLESTSQLATHFDTFHIDSSQTVSGLSTSSAYLAGTAFFNGPDVREIVFMDISSVTTSRRVLFSLFAAKQTTKNVKVHNVYLE